MIAESRLPPLFRLTALPGDADVAAEARRMAEAGAEPGTVVCAERADEFRCAVILHPDRAAAEARLALYVGVLGLGDALGATTPPGIDVTFLWPNRLEANGGALAEIHLFDPDEGDAETVPSWLILYATVAIELGDHDWQSGVFPETSLREEGCAEVSAGDLLESFTRHLLTWINRWHDDGFDPVRAMWLRHSRSHGSDVAVDADGTRYFGTFKGIDDDGAMMLEETGVTRRIEPRAALEVGSGPPS